MSTPDTPAADDPAAGARRALWCPTCHAELGLEDPEVRVELTPQNVQLLPDGTVQPGELNDAFLDYWHIACGTHVRFTTNSIWNGEAYGPDDDPMVEVDPPGSLADRGDVLGGSWGGMSNGREEFRPSFVVLLGVLEEARRLAGWPS